MKRRGMVQNAAVVAGGIAMTAGLGLAGAGTASAAAPALKIHNGDLWTVHVNGKSTCEVDTFNTITHRFTSDLFNHKGTWSGGASTIFMTWKKGVHAGGTFSGTFSKPPKAYISNFGGTLTSLTGQLVM
jgi:hypothetical protein